MGTVLLVIVGIILFGLLIAVHEFGHFITAKLCGVRVNEFAIGMGPKLFSRQGKETLYSLRLFPIGGFCAMEGEDEDTADPRSFQKAKAWKKLLILVAGAFMNFLVGFLIYLALFITAEGYHTPVISSFLEGYVPPASSVQLQEGDRILSIDGHAIFSSDDISIFFERGGDDLDLVVRRNGQDITLDDYHMPFFQTENGPKRGIALEYKETTLPAAFSQAWYSSIDTVRLVWMGLGDLFTGAVGLRDVSGPVGIVDMMGQVAGQAKTTCSAFLSILSLVAFIAVNLAVMNLLPIPALDGGRIFFLFVNMLFTAVTKKRLDPKYEGVVNAVFLVGLLVFMAVVAVSDMTKIIGR